MSDKNDKYKDNFNQMIGEPFWGLWKKDKPIAVDADT